MCRGDRCLMVNELSWRGLFVCVGVGWDVVGYLGGWR